MSLTRLAILALCLCGATREAAAQEPADASEERARELYQNGAILYEEGRYEEAILAWEAAYKLSSRPQLLFNIANAEERLGHWREALDYLNQYRAYARAEEREVLERRMRNLEARIAELERQTPVPSPVEPAPTTPTGPAPAPSETASVPVAPIVLFSAGGVGLATGVAFGVRATKARNEAASLCVERETGALCPSSAQEALDRGRTSALVADLSIGLGAAAAVGGALSLVLGADTAWSAGPGGLGLTWTGRF